MAFKVAAVQMCSGVDPERNVETMQRLVAEAVHAGAIYIQTPEMTGALQRDRKGLAAILRGEEDDLVVAAASALARQFKVYLHVGSTAIGIGEGKAANRAFLFGPEGQRICSYDKIHMFDVDLDNGESWRESSVYRPGSQARLVQLPFASLGFAICYDLRFPSLFKAEALAGAEILTVPAAFTRQTGEAHWEILLRARAIENGAFVVAAAQAGKHEDGRETYGNSMIVDPWGRVLARAEGTGERVILADVDVAAVAAARAKIPNLRNGREFSLDILPAMAKGGVTV